MMDKKGGDAMACYSLTLPLSRQALAPLRAGDRVLLTGDLYTARDAAHKRMDESLDAGLDLPMDIRNNIIYYMGPSPAREGCVIGSAGPTTASRMDRYTPRLLDLGLKGMIGKGKRSPEVIEAIIRREEYRSLYRAIDLLSDTQKEAVMLFYFSGLSIRNISDIIGKSETNTKVLLCRAREKLRTIMEGEQ